MSEEFTLDMGDMSYIDTDGKQALYLGTVMNALELSEGFHKRAWAILHCACDSSLDNLERPGFAIKKLNHWDGQPYPFEVIEAGLKFIKEHMEQGDAVLVCCMAGMSRSPGMVLAYLLESGYSYNDAIRRIRKARHFIQIHPAIDHSVRQYFHLAPRTVADLIP
jgi:hypothetical protein